MSNFNNTMPVSISIKQLSKGCRCLIGNFIENDDKCLNFIKLATTLGFNSNEAVQQINTEREYINLLIKDKNENESSSKTNESFQTNTRDDLRQRA